MTEPTILSEMPRHLTDPVLQSAEEAVLTNPASAQLSPAANAQGGVLASYRGALAGYVVRKPGQAAWLALAAGALAAALLRSMISRRRR